MLISTAEHTIQLAKWGTKRELVHGLVACDAGSILLGDDIEEPREFYSAVVYLEWPKTRLGLFGIGICSESDIVTPHLLVEPNTDLLLLGMNAEAVGIRTRQKSEYFRIGLDSAFNSFIYLKQEKIVLISHEIGVVAMTAHGQELWRYSKDIIVDLRIEESTVSLSFMDSAPVALELASGRVIRPSSSH